MSKINLENNKGSQIENKAPMAEVAQVLSAEKVMSEINTIGEDFLDFHGPKEFSPEVSSKIDTLTRAAKKYVDLGKMAILKRVSEEGFKNALEKKEISEKANFQGGWTSLLRDRMLDPITKEKFIAVAKRGMDGDGEIHGMRDGVPGPFDKPKAFKKHLQDQIDSYDENMKNLLFFSMDNKAEESGKNKTNLGVGNIGVHGTVFSDATHRNGEPLTSHQKDIVRSHEGGHGVRDFNSPYDRNRFLHTIDEVRLFELSEEYTKNTGERYSVGYLKDTREIAERMSQVKNYFGMGAQDQFTKKHLDYARKNYVKDTGLDNSMSMFFDIITPETEGEFLKVINEYPI